MNKINLLLTISLISLLLGCDSAGKPAAENTNVASIASKNEKPQTAIAHSLENQTPKDAGAGESGPKSKWTQGGDPIDTKELDSAIASAEMAFNKKSGDAEAKKALDADDHSAVNHNNYGIALLVAGRPFDARDEFKKALDLDGNLAGALYNMAIVQTFYFFDDTAGRDWYARYLKVDTDDPDNLKAHFDAVVTSTEPAEHKGKP